MTEEAAKIVIVAGGFVGLLVWIVALACYRRMASAAESEFFEAELPGREPEDAIAAVVDQVKQYANMAKFSRPTPTSFSVEQFGIQTHFAAERHGGAPTRLVAGVDDSRMRRWFQVAMGLLVLLIMPMVIFGLCTALWVWAAPVAGRWPQRQTWQIVQMIHVLWPPFLIYYQWRQLRGRVRAMVTNLFVLIGAGT